MAGVIDPAASKIQTNITSKMIEQLPKGTSFNSLLRLSPATRQESLSGGFQVDGASGSENSFLVDGLSVENFRTGVLNGVNNIPTELVAEMQIKTGGFEAEHGGASGAVVSVVTRSGNDAFHGDFGTAFDLSRFQPSPRFTVSRFVSSSSSAAAIAANPDIVYAIAQKKDLFSNIYPSGTVGGPIVKKRVWFLGSYSPQIFMTTRTSYFISAIANSNFTTGKFVSTPRLDSAGNPLPAITYKQTVKNEYAFGRMDVQFFSKLRGAVTYLWNPAITHGNIPFANITTSNPVNTTYAGVSYSSHDYSALRGGRNSSNNFTSHLEWTPNNKLVVTGRYGRAFQNEKAGNYAIPEGVRSICSGSASAYATIVTGCPGGIGYQNLASNSITTRDVSIKNELSVDASYLVNSFGGKHDFKGGYLRGRITNDVLSGFAGTGIVTLFYGQDYAQALPAAASLKCTLGSA
ncbi:MAG TPA: TonB-dependent receptor plug domain-containing protein, partial [Nitrososphaera sp.]|nr:TonB-dependent receptor plug domain-containing protein [Nitrososphaera sp.]